MTIELIAKWKIKESETERILKILPELAEKSRNETGNVFYAIYRSESDPDELILHEQYRDEDAVETHKSSEHYQAIVVREIIPHLALREVTRVQKFL